MHTLTPIKQNAMHKIPLSQTDAQSFEPDLGERKDPPKDVRNEKQTSTIYFIARTLLDMLSIIQTLQIVFHETVCCLPLCEFLSFLFFS